MIEPGWIKPGDYSVVRWCCKGSVSCMFCKGMADRVRVVQITDVDLETARRIARNWADNDPTIEPEVNNQ